ncbi:MAG: hypothetical protein ACUVTX_08085 [Bacteroidales bacterium]
MNELSLKSSRLKEIFNMTSIQPWAGFLYKENAVQIVTNKRSGYRHCESQIIPKQTINSLYYRLLYGKPEPDMVINVNEGQKLMCISICLPQCNIWKTIFQLSGYHAGNQYGCYNYHTNNKLLKYIN